MTGAQIACVATLHSRSLSDCSESCTRLEGAVKAPDPRHLTIGTTPAQIRGGCSSASCAAPSQPRSTRCLHRGLRGAAVRPGRPRRTPRRGRTGDELRRAGGRRGWSGALRGEGREGRVGRPAGLSAGHRGPARHHGKQRGRQRDSHRGSPRAERCVFKGRGRLSAPSSIHTSLPAPSLAVLGAGRRRLSLTKVCGGGSPLPPSVPPSPGNKWLAAASRGRQQQERGCEEDEEGGAALKYRGSPKAGRGAAEPLRGGRPARPACGL